MTEITLIADPSAWLPGHLRRRTAAYRAAGLTNAAATALAERGRERAEALQVAAITADGRTVGHLAVGVAEENGVLVGRIGELRLEPGAGGEERHRLAAREWAERWCAERGARQVFVGLTAPDPLFDDYGVRGQNRCKPVGDPAPLDGSLTYRPLTAAEYPAWLTAQEDGYVADIVRAGALDPAQARAKSDRDFARLLPQGVATEGHAFIVLEHDGEPVGTGWLHHGFLPGVTFGYSLEVHPEHRGRGHGHTAMAVGERATAAAGDDTLLFNVFGGNEVAMNLYTAAGYRILEEHRSRDLPA
ncbi:GNAT family N-acetyltransferase [Kitasatospora sp. NPDC059571]|uniref:GNAT family N-acetyltransferase n=1 Tax=Kitasatospora sp. NPDC059571 TaxID=3346871 RepID=UPI00367A12BC